MIESLKRVDCDHAQAWAIRIWIKVYITFARELLDVVSTLVKKL